MVSSTGTGIKFIKSGVFRYLLDIDIHRFLPSITNVVPVPTVTKPYLTKYI
ncbi:hypothetical protein Hanom_Chr14g01258951 [Helianthus anomalus]